MKRALVVLSIAAFLAGCATSGQVAVPALKGTPRVPVNQNIPDTVPYTEPANDTTTEGD